MASLSSLLRVCLFFLYVASCVTSITVTFEQNDIYVDEDVIVGVNFTLKDDGGGDKLVGMFTFVIENLKLARVASNETLHIDANDLSSSGDQTYNGSVSIKGIFLGYTYLRLEKASNGSVDILANKLKVGVVRAEKAATDVFTAIIAVLIVLTYYKMGTTIDLQIMLEVIKKPISPCICLFSQCLLLPLFSYFIGWLLFDEVYYRLGLFIFGCSPGGGSSNLWTMLLGANVNLSISMTFISTIISMVSMPLWLYTLGRQIFGDTKVDPQFGAVLSSVATTAIALCVGFVAHKYFPRFDEMLQKWLKWLLYVLVAMVIVLGLYTNLYVFRLFTYRTVSACLFNTIFGSGIGFLLGSLFRRSVMDSVTIAIEVGIQNMGISLTILRLSLPRLDADLASSIPFIANFITPIVLSALFAYFYIRKRYYGAQYITEYELHIEQDKPNVEKAETTISVIGGFNHKFDDKTADA